MEPREKSGTMRPSLEKPVTTPLSKAELWIWGAFGGITPVVAALLVNEGHPFTTYLAAGFSNAVLKDLITKLFEISVLLIIGGAWAYLNNAPDALKAFQLGVAAPAVIVGMVAVNKAKEAAEKDRDLRQGSVIESLPRLNVIPASMQFLHVSEQPIKALLGGSLADSLPIQNLPSLFSGVERRLASDRLIELYPNNKKAVVETLISAIQPENLSTSYRVNLYVARTLRLIRGKWEGTEAQRAAIGGLKNQKTNYRDPTFKENVDAAWDNWKPVASN